MIEIDMNKLALFGKKFLTEFVIDRIKSANKELEYKIYVTDMIHALTQLTARQCGCEINSKRYYDLIKNAPDEPQRSSEDIKRSICDTLKSLGKENDDECI